jgi:hypothetical protein
VASDEVIALDLSQSFETQDAAWQTLQTTNAPAIAWHTVTPLGNDTTALQFGGDETGVALPTGSDSAYTLALPPSIDSGSLVFSQQAAGWASQPPRRIRHASASITGPDGRTHVFVHGGLRNDFSGLGYPEVWAFISCEDNDATCSPTWSLMASEGGPPALFDHTMTVLNINGQTVLIILGGVDSTVSQTTLTPISTIHLFTLNADMSSGSWSSIVSSGTLPTARHGHIAAALSSNEIIIHGGASGDMAELYSDMSVLTLDGTTSASWAPLDVSGTAPSGRAFHSAALVDGQLVMGFGQSLRAGLLLVLSRNI